MKDKEMRKRVIALEENLERFKKQPPVAFLERCPACKRETLNVTVPSHWRDSPGTYTFVAGYPECLICGTKYHEVTRPELIKD